MFFSFMGRFYHDSVVTITLPPGAKGMDSPRSLCLLITLLFRLQRQVPHDLGDELKLGGLTSSKKSLVRSKSRAVDERFPIFLPFIELFFVVNFFVSAQVGPVAVSFAAFHTLVELLSSVDPLVLRQEGVLAESFPTLVTLVGLLSSVDPLMPVKVRLAAKGLPALLTPVKLLPSVDFPMLTEG